MYIHLLILLSKDEINSLFEKYGFKREYNSEVSKSSCVMRLVFETSNSLL